MDFPFSSGCSFFMRERAAFYGLVESLLDRHARVKEKDCRLADVRDCKPKCFNISCHPEQACWVEDRPPNRATFARLGGGREGRCGRPQNVFQAMLHQCSRQTASSVMS